MMALTAKAPQVYYLTKSLMKMKEPPKEIPEIFASWLAGSFEVGANLPRDGLLLPS